MKNLAVSLLILSLLTACGFQPLHSKQFRESNAVNLSSVQIDTDTTHFGQLLKAEIQDQINPDHQSGKKAYIAKITFVENEIAVFINPDGTSSRGDIEFNSKYTITRVADGKVVATGNVKQVSSYNNSENADYASYVSEQDARKRAVIELAQVYRLRLANMLTTLNDPNAGEKKAATEQETPALIPTRYQNETYNPGR